MSHGPRLISGAPLRPLGGLLPPLPRSFRPRSLQNPVELRPKPAPLQPPPLRASSRAVASARQVRGTTPDHSSLGLAGIVGERRPAHSMPNETRTNIRRLLRTRSLEPTTTECLRQAQMSRHLQTWVDIVMCQLGYQCTLFRQICASERAEQLACRPVVNFAPTTLARHFGNWLVWCRWATAAGFSSSLEGPDGFKADCRNQLDEAVGIVADFFYELQEGLIQDRGRHKKERANAVISALTFVARTSGAQLLNAVLKERLVQAFRNSPFLRKERAEALPLFLALAVAFEYRIMTDSAPLHERMFLGFLVFLELAGLRFMDGQRCSPSSLSIEGQVVRACPWEVKMAKSGQPCAGLAHGIVARLPQLGPLHHYFLLLRNWLETVDINARELFFVRRQCRITMRWRIFDVSCKNHGSVVWPCRQSRRGTTLCT